VKVTTKHIDDANVAMSAIIQKSEIETNIDKLAANAGKSMKIAGFRKGKVPAHVVKKMHLDKLTQDAEAEALRKVLDTGSKEAKIDPSRVIGQPNFKKYEKTDDGIEVELEISLRPIFDTTGYEDVAPKFDKPTIEEKEIDERLQELILAQAPFEKIKEERGAKNDDNVLIDFEGKLDGVPFDGGKAEQFNLKLGSGQFIPGFEEQLVGMNMGESKTITVTFPEEYGAENLAGKEATFDVKLHEIQEKVAPELNDELASKLLHGVEGASVEMLKERTKEQLQREKISALYNEELKPKLLEALIEKFDFALPNNIVEQEIDVKINQKAREMSKEELEDYKANPQKVETLRDEVRDEARESVKATFIVDALAKEAQITVNDQEVSQAIHYEALMSGQDPKTVIEYYQKNNLLPAIKMGIIEDKLFSKLLGLED